MDNKKKDDNADMVTHMIKEKYGTDSALTLVREFCAKDELLDYLDKNNLKENLERLPGLVKRGLITEAQAEMVGILLRKLANKKEVTRYGEHKLLPTHKTSVSKDKNKERTF